MLAERIPMDLSSTFATIETQIPEHIEQVFQYASAYIPENVGKFIRHAANYMPAELDLISTAEFMLYFGAASLILGVLGRLVLGKRSSLNQSLSSVMAILLIYAVSPGIWSSFSPHSHLLLSREIISLFFLFTIQQSLLCVRKSYPL